MKKFLKILFLFGTIITIILLSVILYILNDYGRNLPNHRELKNYSPPISTRLYSGDGLYLKEYAKEKRIFLPIYEIPDMVKNAFISAEDSNFYTHPGIDFGALIRAVLHNIKSYKNGDQLIGASTITQQVAKNFLLARDRTIERKIKEAILSFRMTQTFSKDRILELYLNQIYLGYHSYGIASAAINYFDKSVDELTIEEAALLAALPKSPGSLNPYINYDGAIGRRNWVLNNMYKNGYITLKQLNKSKNNPIELKNRTDDERAYGEFFSEEVRKKLVKIYGEEALLTGGMVVNTTLDKKIQDISDRALKKGLENYDKRHGFRGELGNIYNNKDFNNLWPQHLKDFKIDILFRKEWEKAVVLSKNLSQNKIIIGLENSGEDAKNDKKTGFITLQTSKWARKYIDANNLGSFINNVNDLDLNMGDIILVEKLNNDEYILQQVPNVNGSVIVMDPHNGRVLAMMGGYIDNQSSFNRATQAERQPGSALKTFAYIAALENGMNPASIIMDEEIQLNQGDDAPPYIPKNYSEKFYGPTTLRKGLEYSRNVTTVRMASEVGLRKITNVVKRFNINKNPRRIYSLVLGSTETNLIKLTTSYAMIVNGGKSVTPTLIERIQDKSGNTIYRREKEKCNYCLINISELENDEDIDIENIIFPEIIDNRKTIIDSATAYQITSMLEGAVQRGTAYRAKAIGKPVGGKTGTSNNWNDAWFVGFTPDLVVGVYVGFDQPATLGEGETGSKAALPIFIDIMKESLKNKTSVPFRVPSNIKLIKIDRNTGTYITPATENKDIIYEAFKLTDKINTKNPSENMEENEFIEPEEILDSINNDIY